MFRITCYDSEGYPITHLTQWDIDQTLVVEDSYITEHHEKPPNFHFCNKYSENALVVETKLDDEGRITADVPNILLQEGTPIVAYVYIYGIDGVEGYSKSLYTIRIPVRPRPKPDDYMYTETEILTWQRLEERMKKLIQEVADNLDEHMLDKNNPHEVTKAQVGLGNVDNTSDLDKPISNATQAALNVITNNLGAHVNNKENPHEVTKAQVGLSNVPNVTTNNQTPTYTKASTLTDLVSGEKLSVAFGKIAKAISDLISHIGNKSNPHNVTKAQVGLSNVNNTSDVNKPISTATQAALDAKADIGSDGKIPATQLPSFVDDVLEYTSKSNFPSTGETGKIYVDTTANLTYRWSGSMYIEISPSLALGETSSTAYRGDRGKIAYEHTLNKSNPHETTKAQIGLSNVPNVATNDQTPTYTVSSTLAQLSSGEKLTTAFGKIAKAVSDLISHISNKSNPHTVTKSQIGLGNVDNTSDANKPISTATQSALDKKANLNSPAFTGTPTVPTPTTNTGIANKAYVDSVVTAGTVAEIIGTSPIVASGSGTTRTISHADSGITADIYGNDGGEYALDWGNNAPFVTFEVDAKGHVTSASTDMLTLPGNTATSSKKGLMSSADKSFLDELNLSVHDMYGFVASRAVSFPAGSTSTSITMEDQYDIPFAVTIDIGGTGEIAMIDWVWNHSTKTVECSISEALESNSTVRVFYAHSL